MMGDKPNPTTAGVHNHLGPKAAASPFVAGLLVENGHGANPIEVQLAHHLARIKWADGDEAMLDKYEQLTRADGFSLGALTSKLLDAGTLTAELVALRLHRATPDRRPN